MNFVDMLTLAGGAYNLWYHHQEFIKTHLGMRDKNRRPILENESEFLPPENWEENIKTYLSSIWDSFKDKKPIVLESGQQYKGEYKKIKGIVTPNGRGILEEPERYLYIGQFQDGIENGEGQALRNDTSKRLGTFKDGRLNGRGLISMDEGQTYTGSFKNDNPIGKGKLSFKNGTFCNINIDENSYTSAQCYEKNKEMYYKGDFNEFRCSGKGTFFFENGERYEGEFLDGEINGYGRKIDKYGDELCCGNFAKNKYVGYLEEREGTIYLCLGLLNIILNRFVKK